MRRRRGVLPANLNVLATRRVAASTRRSAANWCWLAIWRSCAITASPYLPICSPVIPEASEVYVARAGTLLGAIVIADSVRPEARQAIATIHGMGIKTMLLTGDARAVAAVVARQLGITEIAADLLPEDKRERVKRLVAEGRTVAMVGDGVNDAPALVEAQVGVAMGSGTDVARESADVVLLGNDLVKFAETLSIARRTRRIIWANFAGTLGVDALGIGLAAFGLLNPLLAAFIHVASELAFILNSARLLPARASGAESAKPLLSSAETAASVP